MLAFNTSLGQGDKIVFSDQGNSYGAIRDSSYTIEVYDKSGKHILTTGIAQGQFIEYWGKVLYNQMNSANITVGCYMRITATNNAQVRINGHTTTNQKYYVFEPHGIVELYSGASEFEYPGIFSLGTQDTDFKFSAKYVNESISNQRVEFEKLSSGKATFTDTYTITVTDMTGESKYTKNISIGSSVSVGDELIQELNNLNVNFGDSINIKDMQNSQVTLNGTPIDPQLGYHFYATQIHREELDVRSIRYRAAMYLETEDGPSEITIQMGSDGYLIFEKGRYWIDTFIDNYTFNIYNPDATLKGSVSVQKGESASAGANKIVNTLNNMQIEAGDSLIISDMERKSLYINLIPIKTGESLTFTSSGIVLDSFARQYNTTITLGTCVQECSSSNKGKATFTACVNSEGNITFSKLLYDDELYKSFNDTFVIKVHDKNGNLKYSQYISEGQNIAYWGKLLADNLNKANIKVTDYFTITGMQKYGVTVNGKSLDPSKHYIFGIIGVFPR